MTVSWICVRDDCVPCNYIKNLVLFAVGGQCVKRIRAPVITLNRVSPMHLEMFTLWKCGHNRYPNRIGGSYVEQFQRNTVPSNKVMTPGPGWEPTPNSMTLGQGRKTVDFLRLRNRYPYDSKA
ncbi:UNVERIFIED_CONTAM: hypothetical protein Slati_1690700 [Sesamum latifolium]|uniref:Uncharacterized protein n=1 Tax=Sesamum latifolium TaxID=2727402 RepID=A0AAW2WW10_9LAMI